MKFKFSHLFNIAKDSITLLSVIGGCTILAFSLAFKIWNFFPILGLVCLIIGLGDFLIKVRAELPLLIEEEKRSIELQRRRILKKDIAALDKKLVKTRGPRDQEVLRKLESSFDDFITSLESKRYEISDEIVDYVYKVMTTSVSYLNDTYNLWRDAKKMTNNTKSTLMLEDRDKYLSEIEATSELFEKYLQEITTGSLTKNRDILADMCRQMKVKIDVANTTKDILMSRDIDQGLGYLDYLKKHMEDYDKMEDTDDDNVKE